MPFTWKRTPMIYSLNEPPTMGSEMTVSDPLFAYLTDLDFWFETTNPIQIITGTVYLWRIERRRVDGGFFVGDTHLAELRLTKSFSPNRELWEERVGSAFYNEGTQEYENESFGDWEVLGDYSIPQDRDWTTHLTITGDNQRYGFPGTHEVYYRHVVDDVEQHQPELVGKFDIRELRVENIRTKCPFDPLEGPGFITFDLVCLPPPSAKAVVTSGWSPTSGIEWDIIVTDPYWEAIPPSEQTDTVAAQSPDSTGKVASVDVLFEGIDSQDEFLTQDVLASIQATASVPGTEDTYANNEDQINVYHRVCPIEVSQNEVQQSFPLKLGSSGPLSALSLTYQSLSFCRLPTSFGYGWSSIGSARVTEPSSGVVVYRSEHGQVKRWEDDGNGNFLPVRSDNYTELIKDDNSTNARYILTSRDQAVLEFNEDGRLEVERDRNGNTLTYSYTGSLLESVSDSKGHTIYFNYGSRTDGQPVEIRSQDPQTGRAVLLDYYPDTDPVSPDRLHRVTDPSGQATEFEYDSRGRLSKKIEVRPTRGDLEVRYLYRQPSARLFSENHYGKFETIHNHGRDTMDSFSMMSLLDTTPIINDQNDHDNHRNLLFSRDERGRTRARVLNADEFVPF